MNYELNDDGYISKVFFGCTSGSCTAYSGTIPTGYTSLDEWADTETAAQRLNAWKIIDGNLLYDATKYNSLKEQYDIEEEQNATATHKWVNDQINKTEALITDEFSANASDSLLLKIDDSGDYEVPKIKLTSISGSISSPITLKISNENLLKNEIITQTISGLNITINEDKTILLNGTATENIVLDLCGNSENEEMLFLIKADTDYYQKGLESNTMISLYNFDGTNRTLINNDDNCIINLESSITVTQAVLSISSGSVFDNITISPQISLESDLGYAEHKENKYIFEYEDTFDENGNLTIERSIAVLNDEHYFIMPECLYTYNNKSILMSDRNLNIDIEYFKFKALDEKFSQIETTATSISQTVASVTDNVNDLDNDLQGYKETIATQFTQVNDEFNMKFINEYLPLINDLQNDNEDNSETLNRIEKYIRFVNGNIILGEENSVFRLEIIGGEDGEISFMQGDNKLAYFNSNQLYIPIVTVFEKLQVGKTADDNFFWDIDSEGNLNLNYGGEE